LVFCKSCSLLQLKKVVSAKYLYTERYGYLSGMNQTMKDMLKGIVVDIQKNIILKSDDVVLDIGCNDKTLLDFYPKKVIKIGFDPVKKFEVNFNKQGEIFVGDYFSANKFLRVSPKKAKVVTAISMFYDLNNPNQFLEDVKKIMDENGVLVIQQNYLPDMLKNNAIDNIVHEHISYFSLTSLINLLSRHGLEVFDVKVDSVNGGSFKTLINFKGQRRVSRAVTNLIKKEKSINIASLKTYLSFSKRVSKVLCRLKTFINIEVKKGKTVYIYGASTRGNTLIQYAKLNNKLIKKAVERNPEKWGTKIMSLNIPIISEEEARVDAPDYMLVLPWFFEKEFIKRESKYLEKGGHFIFPLPKLKIV
jgi:NDP-4-keto-2,6-dideoxyhexose 3-C-methyltransferase